MSAPRHHDKYGAGSQQRQTTTEDGRYADGDGDASRLGLPMPCVTSASGTHVVWMPGMNAAGHRRTAGRCGEHQADLAAHS
jgi:hypothetical protein